MNSSLRSIFSPAAARVLLVAGERAILYLFDGERLAQAYIFGGDEQGLAQFNRCLTELAPAPLGVLIDMVEEEYRQDTIPHVGASDRRAVLERKYSRLFRGTPYRHALRQGRESEGRRDDRVLLTALTRPELLTPWLEILHDHKVPITGIYSLPILSERLLQRIGASGTNILLISLQKASGLRQSFFRDGQLKLSRLAHMPRLGSVPFAAHLVGEVEKLRRYLNSLALISRDSPLSIYILSHGALLAQLEQDCRDSEQEKFVLLDVDDVARRVGADTPLSSHYADVVFARLLLTAAPPNHYAQREETQFYALHRLRIGLATASLALILGSAGVGAVNFVDGVNFKQQALDAVQKAAFYHDRYEQARSKLPATPVEPREIKVAVDAVATLRNHKLTPIPVLRLLSGALDAVPDVQLDELRWQNLAGDATQPPAPVAAGLTETLELSGHLAPFSGDYRAAIALIDGFASELQRAPQVTSVEVLKYPLDVRSEASVSGSANATSADALAEFKLKLTLEHADGGPQG